MCRKFFAALLACAVLISVLVVDVSEASAQRRRVRRRAPAPVRDYGARLAEVVDEYLRGHFEFNPTEATVAGLHAYDARLESRTPAAVESEARRLRATLAKLSRIPEWRLAPDERYDYLILQSHARARLLELEETQTWRRDPGLYARLAASSIDQILKRDYAPIEQRLDALLAREREIARLLNEARANLSNVSRAHTEVAVERAYGSLDFFARVVPQMFARAGGSRLSAERRAEFHAMNERVVAALRAYAEWVAGELLPRANGDARLGAETLGKKLLYDEMIDAPLPALVQEGERQLRETQDRMREVAERVAPGRGVRAALETIEREHPPAEGLVGEARAELDRLRAFVLAEGILTPPAHGNLHVAETPEYERDLALTTLDAPGPFERAADGFYYLTPPEPVWDAEARREYLGRFNRYALTLTSMREVYPGRYYLLLKTRETPSRVRSLFGASIFTDGWAHYSEQVMLDEGFGGNNPKLRLAQLHSSALNLCRYLVGLRMHAGNLSEDGAVEFFAREAHVARASAEREVRRSLLEPDCIVSALGKMELLRLREEWRRRLGESFRLGEFHDRLLSYGRPPIRILRMAMLGEDGGASNGARTTDSSSQREEARAVEFSLLATSTTSRHEGGRAVELITSEAEWRRAWDVVGGGRPLPDVNFDTRAVVLAYQGQQPTGGFSVEVEEIERLGTVLAVRVKERRPASEDITIQVITSPFVAVSIPRPPAGASVRFAGAEMKSDETGPERKPTPRRRQRTRRRPGRRG